MPSGLYADTTLRDLLGLEVGDALVASGGGLEYEVGTYSASGSNISQPTIEFQNEHSRAPDIVMMQLILSPSVLLSLDVTDVMSFIYSYIADFQRVKESSGGLGYHGTVTSSNYSASGNYFVQNSLGLKYGLNASDDGYQSANCYVSKEWFKPRQPAATVNRYFKNGADYKWIAVWLPVETEESNENQDDGGFTPLTPLI